MGNSRELTLKISADATNLTKPIRETIKSLKEGVQLLEKTDSLSTFEEQLVKIEKKVGIIENSFRSLAAVTTSTAEVDKLAKSLSGIASEVGGLQADFKAIKDILGGISDTSGIKGFDEVVNSLKSVSAEANKIVGVINTASSQLTNMASSVLQPSEILEKTLKTLNQELSVLNKRASAVPNVAKAFSKVNFDDDNIEKGIRALEKYQKKAKSLNGISDTDNNDLLDIFNNKDIKEALGDYISDLTSSVTDIEEASGEVAQALDKVKQTLKDGSFKASDFKSLSDETKSQLNVWLKSIAKLGNIKQLLGTLEGSATSVKDNLFTYLGEQLGVDQEDLSEALNLYDEYSGYYLRHVRQDIKSKKAEIEKLSSGDVSGYATSALFDFKDGGIKLKVDFSENESQLIERVKSIVGSINDSIKDTPIRIKIAEDPGSSVLVQYLMNENEAVDSAYKRLTNKAIQQHKKKPKAPDISAKDLIGNVNASEQKETINYNKELNSILIDTLRAVQAIGVYLNASGLSKKLSGFSEQLKEVSNILGEIKGKIPEIASTATDSIQDTEDSIGGLHLKLATLYEGFSGEIKPDVNGAISLSEETEKIVEDWGVAKAKLDALSEKEISLGALLYLDPEQDKTTLDFLQKYVELGRQALENSKSASNSGSSNKTIVDLPDNTVENFTKIYETIQDISNILPSVAESLNKGFDLSAISDYGVTLDSLIDKLKLMLQLTNSKQLAPVKGNERTQYKALSKDIEDATRARNDALLKRERIKEAYNTENTKLYGKNWRTAQGHLNASDDSEYQHWDAEAKKQNKRVNRYTRKRNNLVGNSAWLSQDKMLEEQEKKELKLEEKFQTNVKAIRAKGASEIVENERKKNEALAAEQEKARKKAEEEEAKRIEQEQKALEKERQTEEATRNKALTTGVDKNAAALEKEYKLKSDLARIESRIDSEHGGIRQGNDVYSANSDWVKKNNELAKASEEVSKIVELLQTTQDSELFDRNKEAISKVSQKGSELLEATDIERTDASITVLKQNIQKRIKAYEDVKILELELEERKAELIAKNKGLPLKQDEYDSDTVYIDRLNKLNEAKKEQEELTKTEKEFLEVLKNNDLESEWIEAQKESESKLTNLSSASSATNKATTEEALLKNIQERVKAYEDYYKAQAKLTEVKSKIDTENNGVSPSPDEYKNNSSYVEALNKFKEAEEIYNKFKQQQNDFEKYLKDNGFVKALDDFNIKVAEAERQGAELTASAEAEGTARRIKSRQEAETKFQESITKNLGSGDKNLGDFDGQISSLNRYQAALDGLKKSKKEYEEIESGDKYVVASITEQSGAIAKVRYEWDDASKSVKAYTLSTEKAKVYSFGDALKDTGTSITKIIGAGFTLSRVFGQVDNLFSTGKEAVLEYNSALTNISYTMDLTKDQLSDLGQATIDMARDLRVSVNDALSISQIYANMQSTPEEIVNTGKPTAILANLAGESASTAANQIQSVMQQFNLTEADSMHIADVYDKISANIKMDYAKGIEVIAAGVEAAGQTAQEAGLSFEQLSSIVAKMTERTREDGGTIGNALKTIMVRVSKASTMSDEVDNETLSKASKALNDIGIKVYETSGEYRKFDVIMGELAEKWDSLTDAQRANISYQVAATRLTWFVSAYGNMCIRTYLIAGNTLEPCTTIDRKLVYDGYTTQGLVVLAAKHPNVKSRVKVHRLFPMRDLEIK